MIARIGVIAAAVLTSSCATVFSTGKQKVAIRSSPDATIKITNRDGMTVHTGATPTTVTLDRGAGFFVPERYTVEFTAPGYAPRAETLSAGLNGWYLGNILIGGIVGMVFVDPATGAMYSFDDKLNVALEQASGRSPHPPLAQSPSDRMQALDQMLFDGVISNEEYDRKRREIMSGL